MSAGRTMSAGCATMTRGSGTFRPRRVQTAEGELEVEIPQVREAAEPFVSKLFPCSAIACEAHRSALPSSGTRGMHAA